MITKDDLVKSAIAAGVEKGDVLNLKVSLRAIGKIEGGANTLIEAFIDAVGPEGTIVSDSFIATQFKSSKDIKLTDQNTPSYAGALTNSMVKHPKSFRSTHPIQKFVAIGKRAEELMGNHGKDDFAYGVLQQMLSLNGKNVKIGPEEKVPGVGTTHIVLCEMGYKQDKLSKGVYYQNESGETKFHDVNWVGGCGYGFNNLMPLFRKEGALVGEAKMGNTQIKITSMPKTYEIEKRVLKQEPDSILCNNPSCLDCRLSWEFSDSNYPKFIVSHLLKGKVKKAFGAIYYKLFSKKVKGQENIVF